MGEYLYKKTSLRISILTANKISKFFQYKQIVLTSRNVVGEDVGSELGGEIVVSLWSLDVESFVLFLLRKSILRLKKQAKNVYA